MTKDPYKYFRIEARELLEGLTQGTLLLDKGSAGKDVVLRLLRLAHTLKGAARVVKQPRMAELAHGIEDLLAPHRDAAPPFPRECVDAVLRLVDAIGTAVGSIDVAPEAAQPKTNGATQPPPKAAARASRAPSIAPKVSRPSRAPRRGFREKADIRADESLETVRVEIEQLDLMLRDVSEAATQVAALRKASQGVERLRQLATSLSDRLLARRPADTAQYTTSADELLLGLAQQLHTGLDQIAPAWETGLDRIETELKEARARAGHIRLLPSSIIFGILERSARDAAHATERRIDFVASGGDVRLDGHVLLAVRDALLHVVRNAVAHGIESEQDRVLAGKRPTGLVELTVERRGRRVVFTCRDDGRGMDDQAIRRVAVERGILGQAEAQALSLETALDLVFLPGMSTAQQVTEIAGRGVGLDVVRTTAHRFKGDCEIRSRAGQGTTLSMSVPISLSSVLALLAEVSGRVVAIPSDSVVKSVRLETSSLVRSSSGYSVMVDDVAIPFLPLSRLLAPETGEDTHRRYTAVVVRAAGKTLALGTDRLVGTSDLLVTPLPKLVGAAPLVAGACLDANGDPQLLLDPHGLVEGIATTSGRRVDTASREPAPILVIDDSLTTRMLEQSILESAGYTVDLATSAEEALSKAQARRYGLFVCDVEMPGMNGFEFVARTRADASLGKVPAILVTSLNSASDRKRGLDAGASAYIVKSEFDQGRLLKLIRELVG